MSDSENDSHYAWSSYVAAPSMPYPALVELSPPESGSETECQVPGATTEGAQSPGSLSTATRKYTPQPSDETMLFELEPTRDKKEAARAAEPASCPVDACALEALIYLSRPDDDPDTDSGVSGSLDVNPASLPSTDDESGRKEEDSSYRASVPSTFALDAPQSLAYRGHSPLRRGNGLVSRRATPRTASAGFASRPSHGFAPYQTPRRAPKPVGTRAEVEEEN